MAAIRWSTPASRDLRLIANWLQEHRGDALAAQAVAAILLAVERAGARPYLYPWAGHVHATLSAAPTEFRRALTDPPFHAVYFRVSPGER